MSKTRTTSLTNLLQNKFILWPMILMVTIIWGYSFVMMKDAHNYMGPFTFASARFLVGSLTLLVLVLILKIGLPPKKYWKHLIIVGILQTTIVYLCIMYALRFVDAGKSGIILYSMPMWSTIFAAKFLGEKGTPAKYIGLTAAMLGLLTILGTDMWHGENVIGELLIVAGAISWGCANVYYRFHLGELPKIQSSAFQMLFGTIGILLATIITEWNTPIAWTGTSIYYVLFTGILASALCFTVWFVILGLVDMVTATISMMLVPVFGLVLSIVLLGEKLTVSVSIGSILIISGIMIANVKKRYVRLHKGIRKNPNKVSSH
ncbi:DMT family transporter [Virgibacillus sp. W0181]|uniref:DMT family transporter n=1 Tax=Virgibacillus sp. W0181 TaxID=3391581 RepID=UPI003F46BEF1